MAAIPWYNMATRDILKIKIIIPWRTKNFDYFLLNTYEKLYVHIHLAARSKS